MSLGPKIILPEREAFKRILDGFDMAMDGCRMLAIHQPEKAHMWEKCAEVYAVGKQAVWKLMDERASEYKGTPLDS